MLTTYLADVEQLLDEQRWELALREAFDLPRIAVALSDPALHSSSKRCAQWCSEWLKPANDSENGEEQERILTRLKDGAAYGAKIGLEIHAGHGLTFDNVKPIAAISQIKELNIGHFLIGEAIFIGLEASIRRMRALMDEARA